MRWEAVERGCGIFAMANESKSAEPLEVIYAVAGLQSHSLSDLV